MKPRQLLADLVRSEWADVPEVAAWVPSVDVPVVVADDVCAWVRAQEKVPNQSMTMRAASMFSGPLSMAPAMYPVFWVEATHPDPDDPTKMGYRTGELVIARTGYGHHDDEAITEVKVIGFVENRFGIQCPELTLTYAQFADGTISAFEVPDPEARIDDEVLRWTMEFTPWTSALIKRQYERKVMRLQEWDFVATAAVVHTLDVVATCAFAICKNLRPERVDVPLKVARKRAAALGLREPRTSYSRLRLPGYQQWNTKARLAAGAGAQELPGHLVRAHPKTYRRNADGTGGLGRHHAEGTWLWQPQYRGSAAAGQRIARAEVSPPHTLAAPEVTT